jgi:hypothetical protein
MVGTREPRRWTNNIAGDAGDSTVVQIRHFMHERSAISIAYVSRMSEEAKAAHASPQLALKPIPSTPRALHVANQCIYVRICFAE